MRLFLTILLLLSPSFALAQSADDALEQAQAARAQERYRDALEMITSAQQDAPDDARLIYERALILEAMGEPELALNLIEEHREAIAAVIPAETLEATTNRLDASLALPDPPAAETTRHNHDDAKKTSKDQQVGGFFFTGAGILFAAAAGTSLLVAQADERQVECAAGGSCEDALDPSELDAAEIDRRRSRVSSLRTIGIVSGALSAGLLAWGIWELVTRETPEKRAVRLLPTVGEHEFGAAAAFRF